MDSSRSRWRVVALDLSLALATGACGTNENQAAEPVPRRRPRAGPRRSGEPGGIGSRRVSGELTVWAMGNEGTKL